MSLSHKFSLIQVESPGIWEISLNCTLVNKLVVYLAPKQIPANIASIDDIVIFSMREGIRHLFRRQENFNREK